MGDVRAVLFDFDGTLVHLTIDFGQLRADVDTLLPRYGLAGDGWSALYTLEMIAAASAALGAPRAAAFRQDAEAAMQAIELAAADAAWLHPGAPELLQGLAERGVKVAIVTRNCRAAVESILARSSLHYDALVTRDDVRQVKPHPEHLLTALRLLDVPPQQALMVGDHPLDVRAGRAVGARTVAVLTGYSPAEHFVPEKPDWMVERIGELRECLGLGDKVTRRQGDKVTR